MCTYAHVVGENTPNEGPTNSRNARNSSNHSCIDRPVLKRHCVSPNNQGARENSSTTETCNDTANNEDDGRRRSSAYQRANLKDQDGSDESPLDGKYAVELSKDKLE
jgi:hypothetical protein